MATAKRKKTRKSKKSSTSSLSAAIDAVAKGHKGSKARLRKAITAHAKRSCKLKAGKKTTTRKRK